MQEKEARSMHQALFMVWAVRSPVLPLSVLHRKNFPVSEWYDEFFESFNSSKFNNTYSFKYELKGNILQYSESATGTTAPLTSDENTEDESSSENTSATAASVSYGNENISRAESDGIILYSTDNYEGKTIDTVTAEDFDQNSYHETDLKTSDSVKAGDDVYS